MGEREYRLTSLADNELLAGLASIVGRRNQITAEFLAYLAELDQRQIFSISDFRRCSSIAWRRSGCVSLRRGVTSRRRGCVAIILRFLPWWRAARCTLRR